MPTLIEVANEISEGEKNVSKVTRPSVAVGYRDGFLIDRENDLEIGLDDRGFTSLCDTLQIPKAFARRIPLDLQETLFNRLFKEAEPTYSFLLKGNELIGFTRPEYPYIPPSEMIGHLTEVFGEDSEVRSWKDDNKTVRLEFASLEAFEPQVGDVCRGLINTTLDRTWDSTPELEAKIFRLVCSNGMVSPADFNGKYRISGKTASQILSRYEEIARLTFDHLVDRVIPGVLDLSNHSVKDALALLNSLAAQHNLSKRKLQNLRGQLALHENENPVENLYDFWNFLTYQGTHNEDLGANFQQSLQRVAGHLAVAVQDSCPTCGSDV